MDAAKLKRARLLIVDDQEANIILLKGMLQQAGYTNLTATTDSSQVASLCDRINPDLLLLDLHMPDQDGFAVMNSLPATETRWMPILVLTADDSQEVRERALAAGGGDFVTKPFNRTEVLLRESRTCSR